MVYRVTGLIFDDDDAEVQRTLACTPRHDGVGSQLCPVYSQIFIAQCDVHCVQKKTSTIIFLHNS